MGNLEHIQDTQAGRSEELIFQISPDMVRNFASLTGDTSSIHLDPEFGRRTGYRDNIAHGMLPLMFLVYACHPTGPSEPFALNNLSASFRKPFNLNQAIKLSVQQRDTTSQDEGAAYRFSLAKHPSGADLASGFFTLLGGYDPPHANGVSADDWVEPGTSLLLEAVEESHWQFQKIDASQEVRLLFCITPKHSDQLLKILSAGRISNSLPPPSHERLFAASPPLLAASVLSTLVGMKMPGKFGTFLDFNIAFQRAVNWNVQYQMTGRVTHRSLSTQTIRQDISIFSVGNIREEHASGRATVRVDPPPADMLTLVEMQNQPTDLELAEKVILITGASRGIGETTAKLFALYGARVAINYLTGKRQALAIVDEIRSAGGEAIAVQADVSDSQQVKRMVAEVASKLGAVQVLVNNAAAAYHTVDFLDLEWQDMQQDLDVILKGTFYCCQAVLPTMVRAGKGKIVNIASAATDNPPEGHAHYVAAKNALVGLTRSLAVEFAPHNIQANVVAPFVVPTDLTRNISKMQLDRMAFETPMNRLATPLDVARVVIFLASSLSSFTTGQRIMVTGGQMPMV